MKHRLAPVGIVALLCICTAAAQHDGVSPHAGKQSREIAALDDSTLEAIRKGTGWGLAMPAEIRGAPGPRHVLDLAEPLGLGQEQVAKVTAVFEEMRRSAISKGEKFIGAERALEDFFQRSDLDQTHLAALVGEAGQARADLRLVHLSAHLKTLSVLSAEQVERYAELRGYTGGASDPCSQIPAGHDPVMWKQHNGCNET
ncbi:MAG: hypothetical protein Cons2KO_28690 [Congregibacter sp.]